MPTATTITTSTSPPPPAASPSPPPPPPIPLTPGPRASKLSTLFHSALQKTLSTIPLSKFSACFPTAAAGAPHVLAAVHAQITAAIEARACAEFEAILVERDVVAGLNELERLVGEARARKERGDGRRGDGDVAPHLLSPPSLYLAHLAPYLATIDAQLRAELQRTETANGELARTIAAQGMEADRLLGGLEAVVRDLEGANVVLGGAMEGGGKEGEVGI